MEQLYQRLKKYWNDINKAVCALEKIGFNAIKVPEVSVT